MTFIPAPYDINTTTISLVNKKLFEIPLWIRLLTNLEVLNLDMNRLSNIPDWLGELTNLRELHLMKNNISTLPITLCNLVNLEHIRLHNNHFRHIPECISMLTNLKYFGISHNMIETIPLSLFDNCTNIIDLSISNNYLSNIPSNIENLINLKCLMISQNDIITLPISIIRFTNLETFYYKDNPYEYMPPQVVRFLYQRQNRIDHLHVYSDSESVHNHTIQASITKSIENIMSQPFKIDVDQIMLEISNDPLINCCNILLEYSLCEDIHSILRINFRELLCYVWETIKILENSDEIKKILNIEMNDSRHKCFTGRLSRLINCLNGFTTQVSITIDDSQEIGNIITITKYQMGDNYNIMEHKNIVIRELTERGYDGDTILHWLQYIE